MMGWYGQGWSGWMTVMMLVWPVLIGLSVWAVVALTRNGDRRSTEHIVTAHEILDRRLASGDIAPDEYRSRRDLLENRHAQT